MFLRHHLQQAVQEQSICLYQGKYICLLFLILTPSPPITPFTQTVYYPPPVLMKGCVSFRNTFLQEEI